MRRIQTPKNRSGLLRCCHILVFAIAALAMLSITSGCSKTLKITPVQEELRPPTSPKQVELLPFDSLGDDHYQIVGKVFARHKGGLLMGKGVDDLQETVRKAAAELGADAVIGFKSTRQDDDRMKSGNSRWGSGIAVNRVDGDPVARGRSDFIVALCGNRSQDFDTWLRDRRAEANDPGEEVQRVKGNHATRSKPSVDTSYEAFTKDSLRTEKNWNYVLSAAEYQLEQRGYYPVVTAASYRDIMADSLPTYDGAALDSLFGPYAGHVVHLDLIGAGGYNAALFAGASAQVKATLYDMETKSVVWENSASKSLFPTLGWANVLFESGETRQQRAISKAVKKLFENLRPLN